MSSPFCPDCHDELAVVAILADGREVTGYCENCDELFPREPAATQTPPTRTDP